jgi:hypothetical protein
LPAARIASIVLVLAVLVLANCRRERDAWLLRYPKPLERQAAGVDGRTCDDRAEHDPCDPFVCDRGKCRVEHCENDRECSRGGTCIEGYCALPPPQPGRTCEPFADDGDWSKWQGCACRPTYFRSESMYASSDECGPFPCTPNGCYVQQCAADSDCAAGFCSAHASGPNDWCVTDDPY